MTTHLIWVAGIVIVVLTVCCTILGAMWLDRK